MPVGFGASAAFIGGLAGSTAVGVVSTIGLGVVAGYVSTSASQGWDPTKYKWDQPGLYNSAFQGFSTGASIMGGIGAMHSFANAGKALNSISVTLSISRETGKWIFLAVSYSAGAGAAYGFGVLANEGNAAFWEWYDFFYCFVSKFYNKFLIIIKGLDKSSNMGFVVEWA